jgi:lysophospholipase L1-like esterase
MTLSRRRRLILTVAWFALCAAVILGLSAELWLRALRERNWRATERFRASNIFFAHALDLNAGTRSLWRRPWHKYEPGARAEIVAGGERFLIEINSLGYRTREFSPRKPEGTVRVLCIGGSTTVAGRTNDETYPAILETRLKERWPGLPLEVLNLGISGVTSEEWRHRLPKLLAFSPDVVVQYDAINDIYWLHLKRFAAEHPGRRLLQGSLLFERLRGFDAAELDAHLRGTMDRFVEMDKGFREAGTAYLAASFASPDAARASEEVRRHLDANAEFWTRFFPLRSYAAYSAILARHNAFFVETTDRHHVNRVLVHEQLTDPDLFIDACHFTPEGIGRLAEAMLPAVSDLVEDRPAFRRWRAGYEASEAARASRQGRGGGTPAAASRPLSSTE